MAQQPTGLYRVRRPFIADDRRMTPGDLVVVDAWRNAWQLIDRGYLVVAPDAYQTPVVEPAEPAEQPTGSPAPKRPRKAPAARKQTARSKSAED